MVGVGTDTTSDREVVAVAPLESFTVNETLELDAAVGVPLSDPAALIVIPLGKPVADHV